MPFIFNKNGVLYRPTSFLTTHEGVTKNVMSFQTMHTGVLKEVWREYSAQKMLILSSEIPQNSPSLNPGTYTQIEFPESGVYRVTVIGDGGNGGNSGSTWGAYSGGQGGGGGTGGCIVLNADFSQGVYAYLRLSRLSNLSTTYPQLSIGSIYCQFRSYSWTYNNTFVNYWINPGSVGGSGKSAGAINYNPSGGSGGTGGKVYYTTTNIYDETLTEIPFCAGYNGVRGGEGFDAGPPVDDSLGHGGEAPPDINLYEALGKTDPVHLGTISNEYQRPSDYYTTTTWTNPNAITGYTLDHIALGNAGAGGWKTIVDGDVSPGQGALGGVVIEKLT